MVLDKEFPPDERVEKEIHTLKENGFTVSVATCTFKSLPGEEHFNGYTIYRKRLSWILYKSSAAILLLPFYFRFWFNFLDEILNKDHYDIIHIHDLPLSKTGHQLAKKYHLKLVCDQHEYYSNWIIRTRHYNTLLGYLLRLSPWKKYERYYLTRADLVITVEDSLRKIYVQQVGVNPGKIVTLPNTPLSGNFKHEVVDQKIIDQFSERFVLFYAGSLDHLRGIDFILNCLSELKNDINNILFLVAGKENAAFSLNKLIEERNLQDVVQYVGWVPLATLPTYIAASDICLFVPKADNLEINNTIATKIYQYAAMGKPVIVSEARMMKEFVESNGIGFSVHHGNKEEFCETVNKLYANREISEKIRNHAIQIASQYTWESTSINLVRFYKKMTGST